MGLGDRLSRRPRRGESGLSRRVTSTRAANTIVAGRTRRRHNPKEFVMSKGNKVRKKEVKKPKQDKKVKK